MIPVHNTHINEDFRVTNNQNIFKVSIRQERIQKICRVAWNIFSVIVFPVGIVRLIVNKLASSLIVQAVDLYDLERKTKLLAKLTPKDDQPLSPYKQKKIAKLENEINVIQNHIDQRYFFIQDTNNNAQRISVITADDVELDTLMIQNEFQKDLPTEDQKWIVFFHGNSACYEEALDYLKLISDTTGASVYTGNYRGVMNSKGSPNSSHDLILDGEAMIQKLLASGVQPENILVHGWSLGGGVATEVVAHHQEEGHEMHLCNDRSFASIIHAIQGIIPVIGGILGRIVWLAHWVLNSEKNINKIHGHKFAIVAKNDLIIRYQKSLYKVHKNTHPDHPLKKIKIDVLRDYSLAAQWNFFYNIKTNPEMEDLDFETFQQTNLVQLNHSLPISALDNPFEAYVDNVKLALNLA